MMGKTFAAHAEELTQGQTQNKTQEVVEVPSWLSFQGSEKIDLSTSHRSKKEIIEYAKYVVVDAMTFSARNYNGDFKNKRGYFTKDGLQTYKNFLEASNFLETLTRKKQRITSIVTGFPDVIRSGIVKNRFNWLVRVPLIVSFFDDDVMTPEQNQNAAAVSNARIDVIIKFVRVPSDVHHRELLVESWRAKRGAKSTSN